MVKTSLDKSRCTILRKSEMLCVWVSNSSEIPICTDNNFSVF